MTIGQLLGETKGKIYRHVEKGERFAREERRTLRARTKQNWENKAAQEAAARRRNELDAMGFHKI